MPRVDLDLLVGEVHLNAGAVELDFVNLRSSRPALTGSRVKEL
jgi:hypothetical protein